MVIGKLYIYSRCTNVTALHNTTPHHTTRLICNMQYTTAYHNKPLYIPAYYITPPHYITLQEAYHSAPQCTTTFQHPTSPHSLTHLPLPLTLLAHRPTSYTTSSCVAESLLLIFSLTKLVKKYFVLLYVIEHRLGLFDLAKVRSVDRR